jgi:8-oxo-dGTP diphosphatase
VTSPAGTIDRFVVVPASYVFFLRPAASSVVEPPRGTSGVSRPGEQVLLQLRQNTGFMDDHWAAAAAGHVEKGETAYDAARREAAEEVGISDLDLEFVTAMQRTRGGEPIDERVDFFFTCRSWSGTPRIVEPTKSAALEWFPLAALPDPVVPHELKVLLGLLHGIPPYCTFGFDASDG